MNTSLKCGSLLLLGLGLWLLSGCAVIWRGQEVVGVKLFPGSRIVLDGAVGTNAPAQ